MKTCFFSLRCCTVIAIDSRSHVIFFYLLCSHSTIFPSITRLINQGFLLYKILGKNMGDTIVLHSCFTGTLALRLLVRVCTETSFVFCCLLILLNVASRYHPSRNGFEQQYQQLQSHHSYFLSPKKDHC